MIMMSVVALINVHCMYVIGNVVITLTGETFVTPITVFVSGQIWYITQCTHMRMHMHMHAILPIL